MASRRQAEARDLDRLVAELEARVRSLRLSRRVLLSLLRRVEDDRRRQVEALRREVEHLRARNRRYARRIWEQNRRLLEIVPDRTAPAGVRAPRANDQR